MIGTSLSRAAPRGPPRRPGARRPRRRGSARAMSGYITRLAMPCSSSTVKNTTPLALPGRWRTSTRPGRRSRRPCGAAASARVSARPSASSCGRSSASGWRAQRQPGGGVVQHRLLAGGRAAAGAGAASAPSCAASGGAGASTAPPPPTARRGGRRPRPRKASAWASASSAPRSSRARRARSAMEAKGASARAATMRCRRLLAQAADQPQAEPQRQPLRAARIGFQRAVPVAGGHVDRPHRDADAPSHRARSAPARRSPWAGCSAARPRRPRGGGTSPRRET